MMVRDKRTWLVNFMKTMKKYDNKFTYYIYENDSIDGTREELQQLASQNDNINITCEDNNSKLHPRCVTFDRIIHLSKCRNRLLSMRPFNPSNEWTLIIDSDIQLQYNIFDVFMKQQHPSDAVAVSCNGKDQAECRHHMACWHYYDVYALVDMRNTWVYSNFKLSCNHFYTPHDRDMFDRGEHVQVISAFGGATFYRTEVLNNTNARYDISTLNGQPASEHIIFNKHLGNHGSIYVNPNIIILNTE